MLISLITTTLVMSNCDGCRVLDTALHDLQALMAQAQAMVDLAEQFRLQLARQPPEPGSPEVCPHIIVFAFSRLKLFC